MNDGGLIVERLQMHARRQGGLQLGNLGVHFVGNRERVAVRLAIDVQKDSGLSVGGDDGVNGRDGRCDRRRYPRRESELRPPIVFTTICPICSGVCTWPLIKPKHQLVIMLQQDPANRSGCVRRMASRISVTVMLLASKSRGVRRDLEFRDASALNETEATPSSRLMRGLMS